MIKVFDKVRLLEKIVKSKYDEGEEINMLCCIDDSYVNPMINLMYSIRNFSSRKLCLFILTTNMSKETEKYLKEKLEYLEIETNIKRVKLPKYDIHSSNWSLEVYLKVFAFEYLPEEIEKVLYLDADVIALSNVEYLYDTDISDKLLACSIDVDCNYPDVFNRRRGIGIMHDYFNAGVLLFNLKKQREKWKVNEIRQIIKEKELPYNDQDLLNYICEEKDIKFLPYRFNFQSWWELKEYNDILLINPVFVHYVNPHKPWVDRNMNEYSTRLFYECAALTNIPIYCPGEYFEYRLLENIEKSKKAKPESEINLLCCISENYTNPTINLMYSIRQYNADKLNLYVLSTDMGKEAIQTMQKAMDKLNITLNVGVKKLDGLSDGGVDYWSIDMYLRILAFEYLPKTVEKVLYLDADVQAFGDIAEIYKTNIEGYLLSARKEPWRFTFDRMKDSCRDNNITHDYFSSGVMLLNFKRIRAEWTIEKIFNTIKNTKLYFPDQDVLNVLCADEDICYMNDRFNYFDLYLMCTREDIINKLPVILHYVGGGKPWNVQTPNYEQTYFFKNARLTGIEEYIKKADEFNIE